MSELVPTPRKSLDGIPDYKFKICVIGATSTGKTTIVDRLVSGEFNGNIKATVGVEYKPFRFAIGEYLCQLELWDTAGQETYKSIAKSYFRQAVGCILVFDLTKQSSFDELQYWLEQFRQLASPNAVILLVGNKADLEDQRQISTDTAEQFAHDNLLNYSETSAVNGKNILEVFQRLTKEIFDLVRAQKIFVDGTGHAIQKGDAQEAQRCDLQEEIAEVETKKKCAC